MEAEEKADWKELLDQALEIQAEFKLPSVDTALLMIIQQDVDLLRFHNTT